MIIGERINSSSTSIRDAISRRDKTAIQREASSQVEAGAAYVDVNVGTFVDQEELVMSWAVETIQECTDAPLCIDSANPDVIEAGLQVCRGRAMVNSISGERSRVDDLLPVLKKYDAAVIALAMDDSGIPKNAEGLIEKGGALLENLYAAGISRQDVYLDPLARPLSTGSGVGLTVIRAIRGFKDSFEDVQVVCGLSNISYGLPRRSLVNRSFLVAAMAAGLDAAILDPLDGELMGLLRAAEVVLGQDAYCLEYLRAYRDGRL